MKYQRATDVTWELADDRAVILDPRGSVMITLNPIGTLLWCHLDEERTPEDLASHLARRFPSVEEAELLDDARGFVSDLLDEGLVVAASEG